MIFHVPTVAESTDRQLRDIQNALPDENVDTSSDSDYAVRANAVSAVEDGLYAYQGWIIRQIFPDTAEKGIWSLLDAALAGLVTSANKVPYFTGENKAALADLTSFGRDIISKNAIADILTYLGLHETGFATLD